MLVCSACQKTCLTCAFFSAFSAATAFSSAATAFSSAALTYFFKPYNDRPIKKTNKKNKQSRRHNIEGTQHKDL
jgi:hypothetical protein